VGGDKGAKDISRVLRVPTSLNHKYNPPIKVEILEEDYSRLYSLEQLAKKLPLSQINRKQSTVNNTNIDYAKVENALNRLNPERADDYDSWLEIGMILHTLGNEYLPLWDEWSSKSSKYQSGVCSEKWDTFQEDRGKTISTLFYYANQDDPEIPEFPEELEEKNPTEYTDEEYQKYNGITVNAISGSTVNLYINKDDKELSQNQIEKLNLTDLGNAKRLIKIHGDKIRYCAEEKEKTWYIWNGKVWEKDKTQKINLLAEDVIKELHKEAGQTSDSAERKAITAHCLKTESAYSIRQMVEIAESHLPILVEDFDKDNELVNVNNGIINLKTGELLPHDPKYLMRRFISYDYDPEAQCPKWLSYLNFAQENNQENIRWIQKALGLSISGKTAKILPFLWGEKGDNGKSGFSETLLELFGSYGQKTSIEAMSSGDFRRGGDKPNSVIARMRGARLIISNEIEEGVKLNVALIKDLTGGDTINVRDLHEKSGQFTPTHTLWLYGNHKPKIQDNNEAIWNRVCEIPFTVSIPKEKQMLMDDVIKMFLSEASGILNWIVQGYQLMLREGLEKTESIKKATNDFRDEEDILQDFLDECRFGDGLRIHKSEFRASFSRYMKSSGYFQEYPQKKLTRALSEKGITLGGNGKSFYIGIALSSGYQDEIF